MNAYPVFSAAIIPLITALAVASPAAADELHRQDHADCALNPAHCWGGPASQDARNPGGPGWDSEVVDNIDAAAGWTITNLEFWGGQGTTTPAPTDGFMIRFYTDNNGQVGPLLSTQDVFAFTQEVYFTWDLLPLQGFHYTLDLVQPFAVPAAGRYWMSIVAIQSLGGSPDDRQWGWNLSNSVHAPTCQQSDDPPGGHHPEPYDVAFVLYGTTGGPACPCDFNTDGVLNSQDFFDMLEVLFGPPIFDFNFDGEENSQDFFDFLVCFFTPPPEC